MYAYVSCGHDPIAWGVCKKGLATSGYMYFADNTFIINYNIFYLHLR